jgi:hypothetical protein
MFKTCPVCGDEFLEHVEVCPDCRVALRTSIDGTAPEPRADRAPAALESPLVLRRGDVGELRQLADALASAGVPCVVDTDPPSDGIRGSEASSRVGRFGKDGRLAIFVAARDQAEAARVHAEWLKTILPDAGAVLPGSMIDACPGCHEPLPEGAVACASCGLEFPPLEVNCPQCGRPTAVEADQCSHCGYRP